MNPPQVSLKVEAERFDPVAIIAGEDADAGALRERRHDHAGEAEDGGLVGRAVASTSARPPSGSASRTRRSVSPSRSEWSATSSGSASRSAPSAPLPAFW